MLYKQKYKQYVCVCVWERERERERENIYEIDWVFILGIINAFQCIYQFHNVFMYVVDNDKWWDHCVTYDHILTTTTEYGKVSRTPDRNKYALSCLSKMFKLLPISKG